jgi:hypothetical protein
MRLVLGKLKEVVGHKSPPDMLEYRLNRVFERAITSGKWNGTLQILGLVARFGEVALPRYYRTIEGVKVDGYVRDVTNRWWDYLPGKADAYGYSLEYVRDLGDGKATLYALPLGGRGYKAVPTATIVGNGTGAQLQVQVKDGAVSGVEVISGGSGYTTATVVFSFPSLPDTQTVGSGANAVATIEEGKIANVALIVEGTLTLFYPGSETLSMTIYGTDKDFMPAQLTLTGNGTTAANPFVRIDRIHKEQGDVVLTLQHTSFDNTLITPLAIMSPGEEETYYRRYIVDTLCTRATATISALCKLRHVELNNDQDVVPFSNIAAIETGLDGVQYLSENDVTLAKQYFDDMINILNNELADTKSVDEVPAIRFHYPGRTEPRWNSHM